MPLIYYCFSSPPLPLGSFLVPESEPLPEVFLLLASGTGFLFHLNSFNKNPKRNPINKISIFIIQIYKKKPVIIYRLKNKYNIIRFFKYSLQKVNI